jgi:hypothetical protein
MRKIWSGVIAAAFVASVGLSAQEPPAPGAPGAQGGAQGGAQRSQPSSISKTVTISGCIQNAPAASASANAAGASASASSAPKFVLATKSVSAAPGAAVGTSGSASRYQLDGDDKAISPHLNHEVEITGTVQPPSAGGAGAAGAGASAASGPTLKVETVKMVAATCS